MSQETVGLRRLDANAWLHRHIPQPAPQGGEPSGEEGNHLLEQVVRKLVVALAQATWIAGCAKVRMGDQLNLEPFTTK
jgi:hypothetical protein